MWGTDGHAANRHPEHGGGQQIFVDELTGFAARTGDAHLTPILNRLRAPLRVWVRGRPGVGRRTVGSALSRAGVEVVAGDRAEMTVWVFAEVLKPEDHAALSAPDRPALAVLNKVDLAGGNPAIVAQGCRDRTGVPTATFAALPATAVLDDELLDALRVLVLRPAELTTADAFLDGAHPLPRRVRERLLAILDRRGICVAVRALAERGRSPDTDLAADLESLTMLLRRLSGLDELLESLHTVAAPVRYRRVRSALSELALLAARDPNGRLPRFLADDDTVVAVMADAVDVVRAAGLTVDTADEPSAHMGRAVHWQRYGRGPVDGLHRQCAADICRGSLRMLQRAGR